VAKVVELLASKLKVLISNSSTEKQTKQVIIVSNKGWQGRCSTGSSEVSIPSKDLSQT
jgi:hypothetical protein